MNEILKKLWDKYFYEECSRVNTEEERALIRIAAEMHEVANKVVTKEQSVTVENYIDALCEIQNSFVKKAFLKGCEFTASFLFEVGIFGKR